MTSYAGRPKITCEAHSGDGGWLGSESCAANNPMSNDIQTTNTLMQMSHQLLDALPNVSRSMNDTNFSSTSTTIANTYTVWYAYTNEDNSFVEKRPEPLLAVVENAKYLAMYGVELRECKN